MIMYKQIYSVSIEKDHCLGNRQFIFMSLDYCVAEKKYRETISQYEKNGYEYSYSGHNNYLGDFIRYTALESKDDEVIVNFDNDLYFNSLGLHYPDGSFKQMTEEEFDEFIKSFN